MKRSVRTHVWRSDKAVVDHVCAHTSVPVKGLDTAGGWDRKRQPGMKFVFSFSIPELSLEPGPQSILGQ